MEKIRFSVSDFIAVTNQTLDYAYPSVEVEGEIADFNVSKNRWVFFKLKDEASTVECFMTISQLRVPIENGMTAIVVASPKLTTWGRFSLTVKSIRPSGEGALKKSFDILKAKLETEGLFSQDRKRILPIVPQHIGIISSTQAAGYADFIKIVNDRWGGLRIEVANVQVQGADAPDQIIKALSYLNGLEEELDVVVIIRGGGSADDLSAFNDEQLVRAIATSRVPTLVGVGHETDESLADLAADVRASTPTNAAQILVPDRQEVIRSVKQQTTSLGFVLVRAIDQYSMQIREQLKQAFNRTQEKLDDTFEHLGVLRMTVMQLNPENVLKRGYALVLGDQTVGSIVEIETHKAILKAEVKDVRRK